MRKQLYLDIKEKLSQIVNDDDAPLFKHFDLWNRQIEFIENETPFACPAVFVEFAPMDWDTLLHRVQECDLTVTLHIVTEWFAETADYSPTEQQHLEFLNIADKVVRALQNFSTDYMNSWMRKSTITDHDHERYIDSVEVFICRLRDTSAVQETYTEIPLEATFVRD